MPRTGGTPSLVTMLMVRLPSPRRKHRFFTVRPKVDLTLAPLSLPNGACYIKVTRMPSFLLIEVRDHQGRRVSSSTTPSSITLCSHGMTLRGLRQQTYTTQWH